MKSKTNTAIDALQLLLANYNKLPVTVTPAEFLAGHGNWGMNEVEFREAKSLAQQIMALTAAPHVIRRRNELASWA